MGPPPNYWAPDLASQASARDAYSEDGRSTASIASKPISFKQFIHLLQRRGIVPRFFFLYYEYKSLFTCLFSVETCD